MFLRSTPFRTNEAAMKSILLGMPSSSLGVMVGRSTTTPGRFTFFLSPNMAVFSHLHFTILGMGGWGGGHQVLHGLRGHPRMDVVRQRLVAHADHGVVSLDGVVGGDQDVLALGELDGLAVLQHSVRISGP